MPIEANLVAVRRRIRDALRRAGDPERPVTIVAVTKTWPAAAVDRAAAAGLVEIGESRVQEAVLKAPQVRAPVRWHLVGHLQRNKVKPAVEMFSVFHSVDSPRLARALVEAGQPREVFLQINVSGEGSKQGVAPGEARALGQAARAGGTLAVVGLMTLAPLAEDPEDARPHFRALRELRDDLDRAGDGPPLRCLSMGMSGDFDVAVEEGATHVRLGTVLFGERTVGRQ